MSYDQKGKNPQIYHHSFEVEGQSWEQPASSAAQDAEFTQPIKSFGELAPLAQYLRYHHDDNPHQSGWWEGPDTTNTAAGKFNDDDNYSLCIAVAAGDTYTSIKDFWFVDREDVTADDLKAQAYAIHAIWERDEDTWLRRFGFGPDASDEELSRLKDNGYVHSSREPEVIRWRIKHLLKSHEFEPQNICTPGEPLSQDQHRELCNSQRYTSSYPAVDPNYPVLSPCSFVNPSTIHIQPVSQSFVGPSSWSARQYGNPQMPPQTFHGNNSGDEEQCGSEAGEKETIEWDNQRQVGSQLNAQEQAFENTGRRGGVHIPPLRPDQLEDIKLRLAEGYTMPQISKDIYPGYSPQYIRERLKPQDWTQWTLEQDQELLELHVVEGNNWAAISSKLSGARRNPEEVRTRFNCLTQDGGVRIQNGPSRGRHRYTDEDDHELSNLLALDWKWGELVEVERFRYLTRRSVEKHAKLIGATWSEDDDKKLGDYVLGYEQRGMVVDWESIGQQYVPPRPASAVQLRSNCLRGML